MAEELFPGAMTILYATAESSYGSPMGIKSADAMFTISESLTPQEERDNRPDRSGSADHTERYVGRMSAEWEAT
ncbi:MAG: hypothetical protein HN341_19855, partial [Verrucomicrobia bacterium]|nr:hypothetical protein [Verrucomicrobiota bacterium]